MPKYELPTEPRDDNDWSEFTQCDSDIDCYRVFRKDLNAKCSETGNVYDSNGKKKFGVCVPWECSEEIACPKVGDACSSGAVFGTCNDGECAYDPVFAIAQCRVPPLPPKPSDTGLNKY